MVECSPLIGHYLIQVREAPRSREKRFSTVNQFKRMNIKKMMQQAQKMQEQMLQAQNELADKTVTATAGGGKVTVVANGAGDVLSIKISKEVVDPEDVEMLEDLILSGVQKAIEEGRAVMQAEMSKITGGMG